MKAHSSPRDGELGMTILELIVVLAIVALIATVAAPRFLSYLGRAKSQTSEMQISQLRSAVRLYYVDMGAYPSESTGLGALIEAPPGTEGWRGPYIDSDELLRDAWGRDYVYRHPGKNAAFDIVSLGRDGVEGGAGEDADLGVK